jgi:hypothetical protein
VTINSEPNLTTDAALLDVLEELKSREPIFHRPEWGTTRPDFEKMMACDFWEIGASGRRYSREYALEVLEERRRNPAPDVWSASEFSCRELAKDLYLLTYTLLQDHTRRTRRTTIWRRTETGWQIVFHQGTIVEE